MTNMLRLAQTIKRTIATVGTTGTKTAYLGKGDGTGTITDSTAPQLRTVWFYADTEAGHELGTAILAESAGIPYEDNPQLEGLPIRLGFPPGATELYVIGLNGIEGRRFAGNLTPLESKYTSMAYPYFRDIRDGRIEITQPTSLSVLVTGGFFYSQSTTIQMMSDITYDFTSAVAALTANQHQLAVLCIDNTTGNLATVATTAATSALGSVPSRNEFTASSISALALGGSYIPLGVLYLYNGQTAITETDIFRQFDPRLFLSPVAGSSSNIRPIARSWFGV